MTVNQQGISHISADNTGLVHIDIVYIINNVDAFPLR